MKILHGMLVFCIAGYIFASPASENIVDDVLAEIENIVSDFVDGVDDVATEVGNIVSDVEDGGSDAVTEVADIGSDVVEFVDNVVTEANYGLSDLEEVVNLLFIKLENWIDIHLMDLVDSPVDIYYTVLDDICKFH